jgi:hypothetical protein
MVAGQHKLSRRALLAGACALPLARHCEERSDAAIQCAVSTAPAAGLVDLRSPSARCARNDEKWQDALTKFREADRELEALVHCPNQRVYDRALGRHSTALRRLFRAPAPDLAAAGLKLDLIVRHHVFEANFAQAALASLCGDMRRFAALASSSRLRGFV